MAARTASEEGFGCCPVRCHCFLAQVLRSESAAKWTHLSCRAECLLKKPLETLHESTVRPLAHLDEPAFRRRPLMKQNNVKN